MLSTLTGRLLQRAPLCRVSRWGFATEQEPELTTENAQMLIDKLVKNNNICLFMKGTPESPACGYSNFVVELLKKYGLTDYKAVNVLASPIYRDQVKLYSKWPTYPQLFIAGELIGGSDILHEMHKDQSLQKLLQDKNLI